MVSTKGTALGISLIWYAPFNVSSPLNNLGNCFITVSLFRPEFLLTGSTLSNRLSQDIVSLPTKDYRSPLITNTSSCVSLSLCLRFA